MPWSLIDIPQLCCTSRRSIRGFEQTQLLDAPAFAIAMERLRQAGYDHIVVDAPPVLGSADVNLMTDAADLRDLRAALPTVDERATCGARSSSSVPPSSPAACYCRTHRRVRETVVIRSEYGRCRTCVRPTSRESG